MKVLFVGFGDIGQRCTRLFLGAGWQVTGLRRTPVDVPGVEMVAGDCRDSTLMARLVAEHDLVIASLTPDSYTEAAYRDAYVATARVLRDAVAGAAPKPGLLLWVSSTSVYGQDDGDWVDEATAPVPAGFSGEALLEAERTVADSQVDVSVIRLSGIYGPGRERMIRQVREGHCAPATPIQWTNRIHADDCAGVLFHLAQRHAAGHGLAPVYLGTDCEPVPLHDVHRWLAARMGVTVAVGEGGGARGNRRCSNRLLLSSGYRFLFPSYREGYQALLAETEGGT